MISRDEQEIRLVFEEGYPNAVRSQNEAAYLALYTEDALWMAPNEPDRRGVEEIRIGFRNMIATKRIDPTFTAEEIKVIDDFGYVNGISDAIIYPNDGSSSKTAKFRALWLMKKVDDIWKIDRQIWNNKPSSHNRDIYLSFFMFATNLNPDDSDYRPEIVKHIEELTKFGYTGFEFPIAPPQNKSLDPVADLEYYQDLRSYIDEQGFSHIKLTTNVGATPEFDPSSPDKETQQKALEYLKSRVDITHALRGEIMMGPIIVPYGDFPKIDGQPIWSDELQDHLASRYANAQPILNELGKYAQSKNVKLAIEPITHWETPGPNKLAQLIDFLKGVPSTQVGVVIDSAHEVLDGDGPEKFSAQVKELAYQGRLHYIQVSPPDRGVVHTSWLPWKEFLEPILSVYSGPIAIEIFNAIPDFVNSLRLTRRKFWIPGEDDGNDKYPSAYDIAREAIIATEQKLQAIQPKT